jgi:serine/threonine protein kinase
MSKMKVESSLMNVAFNDLMPVEHIDIHSTRHHLCCIDSNREQVLFNVRLPGSLSNYEKQVIDFHKHSNENLVEYKGLYEYGVLKEYCIHGSVMNLLFNFPEYAKNVPFATESVLEMRQAKSNFFTCKEKQSVMPSDEVHERVVAKICLHVLLALQYIHNCPDLGGEHGDIITKLIFIASGGRVKLDHKKVNCQAFKRQTTSLSQYNLAYYRSMDHFIGDTNKLDDIWSLGLVCMELSQGHLPNIRPMALTYLIELCQSANMMEFNWQDPDRWSVELKDFVSQCLKDKKHRPTASELLEHSFIHKACSTYELTQYLSLDTHTKVEACYMEQLYHQQHYTDLDIVTL